MVMCAKTITGNCWWPVKPYLKMPKSWKIQLEICAVMCFHKIGINKSIVQEPASKSRCQYRYQYRKFFNYTQPLSSWYQILVSKLKQSKDFNTQTFLILFLKKKEKQKTHCKNKFIKKWTKLQFAFCFETKKKKKSNFSQSLNHFQFV